MTIARCYYSRLVNMLKQFMQQVSDESTKDD